MVALMSFAALCKACGSMSDTDVPGLASWLATLDSDEMAVPTALTLPRHNASDSSTHSTMMEPVLPLKVKRYSPPDLIQLPLYFHSPPGVTPRPRRSFR